MRHRSLERMLALPVLLGCLVLGQTLNAFADVIFNLDVPFSGPVANPCVPEPVTINQPAFMHMVFHATTTNNTLHFDTSDNTFNISGVGTVTGTNYTVSQTITDVLNIGAGADITSIDDFHVISHGTPPNFTMHVTVHIAINANGTPTANIDKTTTSCP